MAPGRLHGLPRGPAGPPRHLDAPERPQPHPSSPERGPGQAPGKPPVDLERGIRRPPERARERMPAGGTELPRERGKVKRNDLLCRGQAVGGSLRVVHGFIASRAGFVHLALGAGALTGPTGRQEDARPFTRPRGPLVSTQPGGSGAATLGNENIQILKHAHAKCKTV
ncbi:hypothetical protein GCM10010170_008250 [Dactylosporangium salmoneum]|uniref:Uncharacterized protein n=1 Tax=Dactylosporangium salmoneum TaxID=53361 RepID=A0ABP5SFZ2_9ACTN